MRKMRQRPPGPVSEDLVLSTSTQHSTSPISACEPMCMVSLAAPSIPCQRSPVTITLCLDRSQDVSPESLAMAIQAAKVTVGCMSPCDELGIVTFSTKAVEALPLTSMTPAGKDEAYRVLSLIVPNPNRQGDLKLGLLQAARQQALATQATGVGYTNTVPPSSAPTSAPTSAGSFDDGSGRPLLRETHVDSSNIKEYTPGTSGSAKEAYAGTNSASNSGRFGSSRANPETLDRDGTPRQRVSLSAAPLMPHSPELSSSSIPDAGASASTAVLPSVAEEPPLELDVYSGLYAESGAAVAGNSGSEQENDSSRGAASSPHPRTVVLSENRIHAILVLTDSATTEPGKSKPPNATPLHRESSSPTRERITQSGNPYAPTIPVSPAMHAMRRNSSRMNRALAEPTTAEDIITSLRNLMGHPVPELSYVPVNPTTQPPLPRVAPPPDPTSVRGTEHCIHRHRAPKKSKTSSDEDSATECSTDDDTNGRHGDGHTNGRCHTAKAAAKAAKTSPHVATVIHCFGVGRQHNPEALTDIAAVGGGSYYFVPSPDDIPGAVADAVGGLQSVVVQNVELRLVPVCGCKIKRVHTGWPVHVESTGDVVVRIPRMSIADRKDVLMSITLPKCSPNPHFEKLKRFSSVKEGGSKPLVGPQPNPPPGSDLAPVNEPPDTVQHLAVVATATYTHSTSGESSSCKSCVVLSRSSFSANTRGFGTPDIRVVSEHMRLAAAQALADAIPLVDSGRSAEALKTLLKLWKGVSNLRRAHIESAQSASHTPPCTPPLQQQEPGVSSSLGHPPPMPPEASTIARLLGQVGEDCSAAVQALTHMSSTCAAQTCHVLRMLSHSHACQSTNAPARVMRSQVATKRAGSIIYAHGGAAHAAQCQSHHDSQAPHSPQRFRATARPSLKSLAAEKEAAEQQRRRTIRVHRSGDFEPESASSKTQREQPAMHGHHASPPAAAPPPPPTYSNSRTHDLPHSSNASKALCQVHEQDGRSASEEGKGLATKGAATKALWRGLKKTISSNKRTSKEPPVGGLDWALTHGAEPMEVLPGEADNKTLSPRKHCNSGDDAGSIGSGVEGGNRGGEGEEEPVGVYVSVYANESQIYLIREAMRVCTKASSAPTSSPVLHQQS